MTMASPSSSKTMFTILAVIATVLAIMVTLCGYGLWHFSRPNESERYRDTIAVQGYDLVHKDYSQSAHGLYVGQAIQDEDLITRVSGPGLVLEADTGVVGPRHSLAQGSGLLDDTIRCFVSIQRHDPGTSTVEFVGVHNLNQKQIQGVRDGTLQVVEIGVLCDPQADR
jgi:hypothetical protein